MDVPFRWTVIGLLVMTGVFLTFVLVVGLTDEYPWPFWLLT